MGIKGRRRIVALIVIFLAVFSGLIGRMGFLQLYRGNWLAEQSFRYRMRPTPMPADRGDILDRNGQPLLLNQVCPSVYAQPLLIKSKPAAAKLLAPILNMKPEELETRMNRPSYFEWLKRKVTLDVEKQVRQLGIAGIGFAPEKCRYYPEGDLAVHALGISNLDHRGIEGLELTYDQYLKGKNGAIQCEFTARGQPMEGGECRVMEGEPGLTLMTTLDIGLQRLVEKNTERAHLETRAKRATIMVMDVKTGEILALSQWPRYDPALGGNSDPALRRIFTVADTLPPGSIFKPVTASAALATGTITRDTIINDTGCMKVSGWTICNWDSMALGGVKIDQVMAKSSNVGFGTLGMMLGVDKFYRYHDLFGFTRKTGIDLPGEAVGQWIPSKSATDIDLATQAFGQTLTVSPIQMLTAIAAIANDGKLMWPHLGKALLDEDGNQVKSIEPKVVRQAIPPEVARYVQELMVGVVETGTGKNARVPGYKVGGKTGTATKVVDGKLVRGLYIASFVGFAPYPDPNVAVLISVDEPQGAYYGGQIAAPIFGEVMGEILAYLNAPQSKEPPAPAQPGFPEAPKPPEPVTVPSVINLLPADAEKVAAKAGLTLSLEGSGSSVITGQFPLAGTTAYKGGKLTARLTPLPLGTEQVRVPDLAGKTMAQAAEELALRSLTLAPEGTGNAVSQTPAAGTVVKKGSTVRVKFQAPVRKP
ncbi:MAG: penicillin-binding transpeptidase domain-containing protein [Mycobacterium leprae]